MVDFCKVAGCDGEHYARGWCSKHYRRWYRYGDVKDRSLPAGKAARNGVVAFYKKGAEKRGLQWDVDDLTLDILFRSDCFYCGMPPSNKYGSEKLNGDFIYSGIDRVDNNKGYILGNVVPCCAKCNTAKGTMDMDEFISHFQRVVSRATVVVADGRF